MAELLVKAKKHWMDDLTFADLKELEPDQVNDYHARTQIGDVIVIKPDGWKWGKEECLPNFLIVKMPGVDVKEVEYLISSLFDVSVPDKPRLMKRRRYRIPDTFVSDKILDNKTSVFEVKSTLEKNTLISSVQDKVG